MAETQDLESEELLLDSQEEVEGPLEVPNEMHSSLTVATSERCEYDLLQ